MVATWLPGSLPGIFRSGYGKSQYLKDILIVYLSSATKATKFFKKIHKVRFTGQTVVYRFLEVRCRTSLPVLPSGLSLYGGSLWKKANSKKIKSVLWWCGSSPGRSPCGKPLSSSLSARPANTSRNGVISGKWQKKLRKNG